MTKIPLDKLNDLLENSYTYKDDEEYDELSKDLDEEGDSSD